MTKTTKYSQTEIVFQGKPDVAKIEEFTADEIGRLLAVLPKTIYQYGIEAKKLLNVLNEAKNSSKKTRARVWLTSIVYKKQHPDELTSEGDRRAWVEAHDDVINADVAEIMAQSDYEMAVLRMEYADDLFTAVRKAASLIEKQEQAVRRNDRYGE